MEKISETEFKKPLGTLNLNGYYSKRKKIGNREGVSAALPCSGAMTPIYCPAKCPRAREWKRTLKQDHQTYVILRGAALNDQTGACSGSNPKCSLDLRLMQRHPETWTCPQSRQWCSSGKMQPSSSSSTPSSGIHSALYVPVQAQLLSVPDFSTSTFCCYALPASLPPSLLSLSLSELIKTYSNDNVELLIKNIIESVKFYPRQYLFINNKSEKYTEKGLQKMLYELVPDKNIGINALRSIYTSHFLPKPNKNQINRVAFLMRTSYKGGALVWSKIFFYEAFTA